MLTESKTEFDSSDVIALLVKQRDLYSKLKALAFMQRELVERSNPELLLKVLGNRQKIINQLTAIDSKLKPIREKWKVISEGFNDNERAEVNKLVDDVKRILEDIMTRDKQDTETLTEKKNQIANELKKVRTCKQMNNAYKSTVNTGGSRYFDIGG